MREIIYGRNFYYPDGLETYLEEVKRLSEFLQYGLECFEEETVVVISPSRVLDNLVSEMNSYVDYISVVARCEHNVFLENSRPLERMRKITQSFIDFRYRARDEQEAVRDQQLKSLRRVADSKVTGLDFKIISNSMISHFVYSEMNDSKKKKQAEEADRYYSRESDNIYRQNSDALDDRVFDYQRNVYLPELKRSFQEFYVETFNKCMRILDRVGDIDLTEINNADYDIDASNSCLSKTHTITKEIIYKAICLCPYNPNIYKAAYKNKLFTTDLLSLSITFGLNVFDSVEVNCADVEEIYSDLLNRRFPQMRIIPMLENTDIDIDETIISMFDNLSTKDKEYVGLCIIHHIELEKKKDEFSSIDLTNDIIKFLNRVKLLLTSDIEMYQEIVEKAFDKEIDSVCQKFDDLLIIDGRPESVSAYAKAKQVITIPKSDITLFLKYYDIFETHLMKKIVSLIGSADEEKFCEYVAALNEKISIEYEKQQQEEKERKAREEQLAREKRAREEQLARERKEREEQHKREIEEKKRLIREEIQTLNSELESLGFALFGKKAKRKAEIKSLIERKENEINSIK